MRGPRLPGWHDAPVTAAGDDRTSGLRRSITRASEPALIRLSRLPRAIPFLVMLALIVVGLLVGGVVGFMLITPDLQVANKIDKQLSLSLGPDVLSPVYSYLSLTEESEYITTEEEYAQTLENEQKLESGSAKFIEAMNSFREGRSQILVATNVAARGIDVVNVGLVVNFELPDSAQWLTHRVGRTARMDTPGAEPAARGEMLTLADSGDDAIDIARHCHLDSSLDCETTEHSRQRGSTLGPPPSHRFADLDA